MPTTPTRETLDQRVHDHREELTVLMADTGRCEDISSGLIGVVEYDLGHLTSDRRVKCDIVAVDWSR
ncbi:MAG: hypothetical protein ACRDQU_12880 [Pseudonocardiaceae bacterium]